MMVTLDDVKTAIGVTGDYQDDLLQIYVDEVVDFLKDAGVSNAHITTGIVARGVLDMWNYGAGNGRLSTYFKERATQLAYKT